MTPRYMMLTGDTIKRGSLPFNIYIKDDATGVKILYARKGVFISPDMLEIIHRNPRLFFIVYNDLDSYLDYTFDHVDAVIKDNNVIVETKTNILKDAGRKIFTRIKGQKLAPKTVKHTEKFTKSVVDLILGTPEAHQSLLSLSKGPSYLFAHALNSCTFCILLGLDIYGKKEVKLYLLGLGGLLLDIGLLNVEDSILEKKGKLTDEEFTIIRNHTLQAYKMLQEHKMPQEVLEMVKSHHERFDGSGYPDGLIGGQIKNHVMIAAVSDVYDAMTSERSYRRKKQHIDAITEMVRNRHIYSPKILESLMKIVIKNKKLIKSILEIHS